MTQREFLNAVANGTLTDDVVNYATTALDKMNARNASRSSSPTKKQLENAPIIKSILEVLDDGQAHLGVDIAVALGISTNKVSGICTSLVKTGAITKTKVKVPKRGEVVAYTKA